MKMPGWGIAGVGIEYEPMDPLRATPEKSRQVSMRIVYDASLRRGATRVLLLMAVAAVVLGPAAGAAHTSNAAAADDPGAPVLVNGAFECWLGFVPQPGIFGQVPSGWTAVPLGGTPRLNSTNFEFAHDCGDYGFEKIEGLDSMVILSQDIETPPQPGKPFDTAIYQQAAVTPGTSYSLSGWMLSLCGGSATPNDCPQGYYISKMLGVDPTGGTDPLAPSVTWVEDQRNFTASGWVNLRTATTAQSPVLTVFARIRSPFRWHGNHAFVDAYSLVRAPTAAFEGLPETVQGRAVTVRWNGAESPDIAAIPGGTYQLSFDVQYRHGGETAWTDWQSGKPAGEAIFQAPASCQPQNYEFRLRARSEQPTGSNGAWPNHRYPGDWSAPAGVAFEMGPCQPRAYLPLLQRSGP
jgi:hypothetical protein